MSTLIVLVAGEDKTGKSSLISCFVSGKVLGNLWQSSLVHFYEDFPLNRFKTKMVHFYEDFPLNRFRTKTVNLDNQKFELRISKYNTSKQTLFQNAPGFKTWKADVLIVEFSVLDSYLYLMPKIMKSVSLAKHFLKPEAAILLVGNKIDLRRRKLWKIESHHEIFVGPRSVTAKEGDAIARKINAKKYLECSCVTGRGVQNVFYEAVWATRQHHENEVPFDIMWDNFIPKEPVDDSDDPSPNLCSVSDAELSDKIDSGKGCCKCS